MAWAELWTVEILLAAFAGGAFGAALGALPAFVFTGFLVIAGETANLAGKAVASAVDPAAAGELGAIGLTGSVAFGPAFSPAVSFAGGAAAAAYAAERGYVDAPFDYHDAKNIAIAHGSRPDVLAVGGAFGVLGHWLTVGSSTLGLPYDPIAMGVVLSAVAHRLAFGYDLVGDVRGGLLDMAPFEDGDRRVAGDAPAADGGTDAAPGAEAPAGRFVVEPWLPHQYRWVEVATLGLVVGVLAAYVAYSTGSPFLAFGISAASLLFLNLGVEQTPVTHHISLSASTAALALAPAGMAVSQAPPSAVASAIPLLSALAVGAAFGVVSALAGEVVQRVFYAHADTHFDPPAAAIVIATLLVSVLAALGVFPQSVWVPALG
ncbi:hypothetical protein [Halorussus marinus]|uniref:hypothetical protein n=1 Tax=Halorussus marinus TaxID=2505976 RepID=UPI0010926136|nr:hypothetical protein [Halorussus marinus]